MCKEHLQERRQEPEDEAAIVLFETEKVMGGVQNYGSFDWTARESLFTLVEDSLSGELEFNVIVKSNQEGNKMFDQVPHNRLIS